jgi:hypothetical protein
MKSQRSPGAGDARARGMTKEELPSNSQFPNSPQVRLGARRRLVDGHWAAASPSTAMAAALVKALRTANAKNRKGVPRRTPADVLERFRREKSKSKKPAADFGGERSRPKQKGTCQMSKDSPKLHAVETNSNPETQAISIAKPSAFNLDKFKSKRAAAVASVETLQTGLPLHSIAQATDFVRLHPDEEAYWSPELCFVKVPIKGQKRDTPHLIDEDLAMSHLPSGKIMRFRVALARGRRPISGHW